VETAERICSALSIKYKPADQLVNLNLGLWQGMLAEEIKRKQPKVFRQWQERPDTVCPPQGEMLETARFRIEAFLAKIFKKHKDGVVAAVIPEPLASLTASLLQKTELKNICQMNGARAEVIEIASPSLTNV
jgi:probable phosphoglycerate mutase